MVRRATRPDGYVNLTEYPTAVRLTTTDVPSPVVIMVPYDIATIQTAIVTVSTTTVEVWPGVYEENINFNGRKLVAKSLALSVGQRAEHNH